MEENGLSISALKSSAVLFTRQRMHPPISIYFDNTLIPTKSYVKFLGVCLDSKLSGIPHCEYVVAKCEKILNLLRCLCGVWWGAHPFSLKLLYNALLRSVLDYGTFLLEPCSIAGLRKLDAIQSKALRIIAGAMKSSPLNALRVECGEPPLQLRRQFLADRMFYRVLKFSNSPLISKLHLLSDLVESTNYWNHKSLPCLIKSLIRYKAIHAPTHRSPFIDIFDCAYEALINVPTVCFNLDIDKHNANFYFKAVVQENWPNWHHIYTDASKHSPDMFVGVGIYHSQYKIVQKIKCPVEMSVFTAECLGIVKALEYVLSFKLSKVLIMSDSMSALKTLLRYPFKSKSHFPLIIEARKKLYSCVLKGFSVTFVWIPSHCGIKGNERADRLANEAIACGDLYPFKNYPHDLAALAGLYLRDTWGRIWRESGQMTGTHYYSIQSLIPSKPWFSVINLSKIVTSVLIRMRLGHTTCPAHLAKYNIINSPQCECGHDFGDLDHIFFSCPNHDRASFYNNLISLRVPLPTNIKSLLCTINPSIYIIIADYICVNNIKL